MRKSTVILSAAVMVLATAISMSPAQAAAWHVTASITTASAQSGNGPTITGQLTPAVPGKLIHLQRYYSGNWHDVDTTYTDGAGHYSELVTPTELNYKIGSLKFRAKAVGSGGYTSGASSSVTKTIYGWQSLAYMDATYGDSRRFVDGNDDFAVGPDIDHYSDDNWQIKNPLLNEVSTRYTKWNLQEKCIKLRGFAGIDNADSAPGAEGRLLIGLDGTSHDYDRSFYENELAILDKPLYKTHYLTFKGYKLNPNATTVGVGEPEVLCSKYLPQDY